MISVTVDTRDVDNMLVKLTEKISLSGFRRWIRNDVDKIVNENTTENFESEGGRVGRWPGISFDTFDRRKNPTNPVLQDTGKLRKATTGIKADVKGYEASWGPYNIKGQNTRKSNAKVYEYHQTGTSRMPQRKILAWATGDETKLKDSLETHIMKI